jgi:nicotinate-nucleotide pyrophosphorylase (carboxylating)
MDPHRPFDPNTLALPALFDALVDRDRLGALIEMALDEDLGDLGDVTTSNLVPPDAFARCAIVARADGVVAGLPVLAAVLEHAAHRFGAPPPPATFVVADGAPCRRGDVLVRFEGSLAAILPLERTLLNVLGRMCGVATFTKRHVDAVAGTKARVCCTRKTLPGWRELDKYAVRCGGGTLHRIGLYDAMLVKDNHLGAVPIESFAEAIAAASRAARRRAEALGRPLRFVEVEVDTLDQFDRLLAVEPGLVDIALLDNFDLPSLREAVGRRDARSPRLELEASGGVRLDTIRAIAETGVERISCGGLTHSAVALDVALDLA